MVKITFFDFSSEVNSIQQLVVREKLQEMSVNTSTSSWITDYVMFKLQYVAWRVVDSPRGSVLSLFLFTLYISDFQHNPRSCYQQKYFDDSPMGKRRIVWSVLGKKNHLLLNVNKTRVIDLRRKDHYTVSM